MSNQLTDSYLADIGNPRDVLTIAAQMDEPTENDYLRQIWRHAFMLATVGLDNFRYSTSHETSTVWVAGNDDNPTSARVYDDLIGVRDYTGTEYEIRICSIDEKARVLWAMEHGAPQPPIQEWL